MYELLAALPFVGQIVPQSVVDNGPYNQLCNLVDLVNNLIGFSVYLAILVATVMFVYAGILYVTASANENNLGKAKKVFWSVFWGLFLVLASWLIINIILSVLTGNGLNFWTEKAHECQDYAIIPNTKPGATQVPGAGNTVGVCTNCENVTAIDCKEGVNCNAAKPLNDKLAAMCANLSPADCDNLRITEGWPPQYAGHVGGSQHNNGTAVDVGCKTTCTAAQAKAIIAAGEAAGLSITLETTTEAGRQVLLSAGIPDKNISVNENATENHFHIANPKGP